MVFPKLPASAAYIRLLNPTKRNALNLPTLQDIKTQLTEALTSPATGQLRLLPPFKDHILADLEQAVRGKHVADDQWKKYGWLVDAAEWKKERAGLPDVLVLRSETQVFSSGYDMRELAELSHDDIKLLFRLCAEVMSLIRHSPALVVCPIQGLASAAGLQLAVTTDYPIALPSTMFSLAGAKLGLPCTSPATAVSRSIPSGAAYRLLATGESIPASECPDAVELVKVAWKERQKPQDAFEGRVAEVINRLASMSPQQQAVGKWAYWTQLGIGASNSEEGEDGYETAARWAGRVMSLHVRSDDAEEGIAAVLEKRAPQWISKTKSDQDGSTFEQD
ncbi:hypothetical protein ACHAPI_010679 [Fusarium lateritium]